MNNGAKICPLMSTSDKSVYCNSNCAWYMNDVIPGKCVLPDICFTLCHIEKELSDIHLSMPDSYED